MNYKYAGWYDWGFMWRNKLGYTSTIILKYFAIFGIVTRGNKSIGNTGRRGAS